MKTNTQPTIAIIGRPNVGKSTFFNRLCGHRKAIESDIPKTTVDRVFGQGHWCGSNFSVIDTAGIFETDKHDQLQKNITKGIDLAIEESDAIIFLVDITYIDPYDREIAKKLHKSGKKIFLAANKTDNQGREIISHQILSLGFGEPSFIAAISGRGVGDLLDKVILALPKSEETYVEKKGEINVSLIGRPNVGKSTILNSLLGEDRAIINDEPGTTRDTNDAKIDFQGTKFNIIDTAGIRRRGKIDRNIEKYSVLRSVKAIDDSDIVIVIIDAKTGIANQDAHLAGTAKDMGKSIIIAINKFDIWEDLTEKDRKEKMAMVIHSLQKELVFLPYVPIIFVSGLKKTNIKKLLTESRNVFKERKTLIDEEEALEIIKEAKENNQQFPDYFSFHQERSNPPVFKLKVRNKKKVHFSHLRYLENFIRNIYPFRGTPIFIDLVEKQKNMKS